MFKFYLILWIPSPVTKATHVKKDNQVIEYSLCVCTLSGVAGCDQAGTSACGTCYNLRSGVSYCCHFVWHIILCSLCQTGVFRFSSTCWNYSSRAEMWKSILELLKGRSFVLLSASRTHAS
ncbi:hypothetical protein KC19_VG229000 [Ceratodon purpureus]|uniref:Uncharacterized protein n=1 Tax=Ceratodon purpureus TaxID=3225 RepID=A0A8T0HTE0_CERPU|nr:hypothetical protein KC19_VG229000 [Ceratodon purpureus]